MWCDVEDEHSPAMGGLLEPLQPSWAGSNTRQGNGKASPPQILPMKQPFYYYKTT